MLIENECNKRFPDKNIYYTASIPATFGSNQRKDLLRALDAADINVDIKLLIDEPNAAFISWLTTDYKSNDILSDQTNVLVFDFGAGTCDTSLLEINYEDKLKIKNLSLSRFAALGGDDLDKKIARVILFPQICEENNIDQMDISPGYYVEFFELPLTAGAENLKIAASKKLRSSPGLNNTDTQISFNESIVVSYKKKMITLETPIISYKEFNNCVQSFIDEAEEEGEYKSFLERITPWKTPDNITIFSLIDDTLKKPKLEIEDIKHLLFIGGSSNLPQVTKGIVKYFNHEINAIYPKDMQSHVSKGVAFHSFLSHGIKSNPITDILPETIFLRLQEGQEPILSASTEIPISAEKRGFRANRGTKRIEMPFYSGSDDDSSNRRVIQNVAFDLPDNFDYEEEIYFKLIVDANKVVELEAYYDDELLVKESLNPFANVALDRYSTDAAKLYKQINDKKGNQYSIIDYSYYVRNLIELHQTHGNHKACLNLYEQYFEDEYISIDYHASLCGEDAISKKYSELAYKNNKTGVSCYNLAIKYSEDSEEYKKYLKEAVGEYGDSSAKFYYGKLIKDENPDLSENLIKEAFDVLLEKFNNNPHGLMSFEYRRLISICWYLDDDKTRKKVYKAEDKIRDKTKGNEVFYKQKTLLTKEDSEKEIQSV